MGGVVIDVGKSGTRCWSQGSAAEAAGLAPEDAARPGAGARLAAAVTAAWLRHRDSDDHSVRVTEVAIGTTFLPPTGEIGDARARLRKLWPDADVAIAEDGVLAHAYALGRAGVVASVGTGTIVIGLDRVGRSVRADGWGPDLGDRGSAWAIGRAGMRAAFRDLDRVGPGTALRDRLAGYLGSELDHGTAAALLAVPDRVTRIAGFAVEVGSAAATDAVAAEIMTGAADDLVDSVAAVALRVDQQEVSLVGRMLDDERWRHQVQQRCQHRGLQPAPAGTLADFDAGILLRSPYREACAGG